MSQTLILPRSIAGIDATPTHIACCRWRERVADGGKAPMLCGLELGAEEYRPRAPRITCSGCIEADEKTLKGVCPLDRRFCR